MSDTSTSLPPAAATITHPVADFDQWKQGFDEGEEDRRAAGLLGHHLNRGEEDPNLVSIYIAISDVDRARAFSQSEDLQTRHAGGRRHRSSGDQLDDAGSRSRRLGP